MTNKDMNRDFLSKQFIRLGDMMGDGLHHEPDGKWISKEYKKIMHILHPEIKKEQNIKLNKSIAKRLIDIKCKKCQGELRQSRSGSRVVICKDCGSKYKFEKKQK